MNKYTIHIHIVCRKQSLCGSFGLCLNEITARILKIHVKWFYKADDMLNYQCDDDKLNTFHAFGKIASFCANILS